MELLNEANAKVLQPARLFRISGPARLPGDTYYLQQGVWAVPVEDDYLLGFVHMTIGEKNILLSGALDYESATRLSIEVGIPQYFHPVFVEPRHTITQGGKRAMALDAVLLRLYPDYDGQEPLTMEVL